VVKAKKSEKVQAQKRNQQTILYKHPMFSISLRGENKKYYKKKESRG